MAVRRYYVRCDVCSTVTMLRWQLGWLAENPIRIPCCTCGILVLGKGRMDQEAVTADLILQNGTALEELVPNPTYYAEVSGEFITSKVRPFIETDVMAPTPYIRMFQQMGPRPLRRIRRENPRVPTTHQGALASGSPG